MELQFVDGADRSKIPEAARWSAGFVAHVGDEGIGLGIALYDQDGKPIAAVQFEPQEAIALSQYILRNAVRLFTPDKNGKLAARLGVHKAILNGRAALNDIPGANRRVEPQE